jgi:hypothetical protein
VKGSAVGGGTAQWQGGPGPGRGGRKAAAARPDLENGRPPSRSRRPAGTRMAFGAGRGATLNRVLPWPELPARGVVVTVSETAQPGSHRPNSWSGPSQPYWPGPVGTGLFGGVQRGWQRGVAGEEAQAAEAAVGWAAAAAAGRLLRQTMMRERRQGLSMSRWSRSGRPVLGSVLQCRRECVGVEGMFVYRQGLFLPAAGQGNGGPSLAGEI